MEEKKQSNKKRKYNIAHFLGGGILTEDFIVKQSKLLLMIVVLTLFFISNRYSCLRKMSEIENLNRELKDLKYEYLVISSDLTTNSRQSQIEALLRSKNINLSTSKTPAFELKK